MQIVLFELIILLLCCSWLELGVIQLVKIFLLNNCDRNNSFCGRRNIKEPIF